MRNWINIPRVEGRASRQAHADLPDGTFEHEIGREGFFGPAAHIHHAHAPTGWVRFEGPIRPRAFDTTKFDAVPDSAWMRTSSRRISFLGKLTGKLFHKIFVMAY